VEKRISGGPDRSLDEEKNKNGSRKQEGERKNLTAQRMRPLMFEGWGGGGEGGGGGGVKKKSEDAGNGLGVVVQRGPRNLRIERQEEGDQPKILQEAAVRRGVPPRKSEPIWEKRVWERKNRTVSIKRDRNRDGRRRVGKRGKVREARFGRGRGMMGYGSGGGGYRVGGRWVGGDREDSKE